MSRRFIIWGWRRSMDPADLETLIHLARACTASGRPHSAIRILEALTAGQPGSCRSLRGAGRRLPSRCPLRRRDPSGAGRRHRPGSGRASFSMRRRCACTRWAMPPGRWWSGTGCLRTDAGLAAGWFQSHASALQTVSLDDALRRLRRAAECHGANGKYWAFLAAYALFAGQEDEAARIIAGPLTVRPHHMALVDGVRALLPHLSADFRLFGCSADLLRHGVAEAGNGGAGAGIRRPPGHLDHPHRRSRRAACPWLRFIRGIAGGMGKPAAGQLHDRTGTAAGPGQCDASRRLVRGYASRVPGRAARTRCGSSISTAISIHRPGRS